MNVLVSVFIPCYNETQIIQRLLKSIYDQSYPRSLLEVIIVDGMSTDDTREKIKSFSAAHPELDIKVISNEKKFVTYAVNKGLKAAKGDILIRMDAHSIPADDYISRCVSNLQEGKGDNVGGLLDIQPGKDSYVARSIAIAAAHPIGTGGAQYRSGSKASEVDTVAFGAFKRETLLRNGFFNEDLMANEDYEWNTRLRMKGGRIWFDPAIRCKYFSRSNYRALFKQYFNYGYWKVAMLRLYPNSIRLRQLAPPIVVLTLMFSSILLGLSLLFSWSYLPWIAAAIIFAYFAVLTLASFLFSRNTPIKLLPGLVVALAVIHLSWGSGFWYGLIKGKKR